MQLPYFYEKDIHENDKTFLLSDATHKHTQVLRKRPGDQLQLLNGQGLLLTATLTASGRHQSVVEITGKTKLPPPAKKITIAISLLKNASRFEWFLEKAVEVGVTDIIPLLCEHTEKQHYKKERMQQIVISAMLQSRQAYLAHLSEPVSFKTFVTTHKAPSLFIAHCADTEKKLLQDYCPLRNDAAMLIGPEGDFSEAEIREALANEWQTVSMGDTRLRSETAGIYSSILLTL